MRSLRVPSSEYRVAQLLAVAFALLAALLGQAACDVGPRGAGGAERDLVVLLRVS